MEETFIEMLDQLYWKGYAEQLREENPEDYQKQLIEFICNYQQQKNETRNNLRHGAGSRKIRPRPNMRHSSRDRDASDLFS